MIVRILFFCCLLALASEAAPAQTWRALGSTAPYVHRIKVWNDNTVIACSDSAPPLYEDVNQPMEYYSGEGYQLSSDGGTTFAPPMLKGFSVRDILRVRGAEQTWIAAVAKPFSAQGGTVRSVDGGAMWSSVPDNSTVTFAQLLASPSSSPFKIFAAASNTSEGIQVSMDTGRTFNRVVDIPVQSRSIAISKADTSLMFMAGDARHLAGVFVSKDAGVTWKQDTSGLEGKRILCVTPSAFNAHVVYCGTDSIVGNVTVGSGIYRSLDTGKTWHALRGPNNARIWQIVEHPLEDRTLIAAGDSTGVWITTNWGDGWERWNDGMPANVVVRTVELATSAPATKRLVAYAGTYGNGIYKSGEITTRVDVVAREETPLMFAPNPANDHIRFSDGAPSATVLVRDLQGRIVLESTTSESVLTTSQLSPGIYVVSLLNEQQHRVQLLHILR